MDIPQPSSWIDYPEKYKFTSIEVLFDYDKTMINR